MITNNLAKKSIACLELKAVDLGVGILQKLRAEFSGEKTVNPINIKDETIHGQLNMSRLVEVLCRFFRQNEQEVCVRDEPFAVNI